MPTINSGNTIVDIVPSNEKKNNKNNWPQLQASVGQRTQQSCDIIIVAQQQQQPQQRVLLLEKQREIHIEETTKKLDASGGR